MNGGAGPAFELEVASLTDVGTERAHNEDRCGHLLDADRALLVVADGVSSAAAGETAAQTAVDAVLRTFAEQPPGTPAPKRLNRAAQQANIEVYDLATVVPELRGMTTTLTVVAVDRGELAAVHVGDTRLYLLREGRLLQLTKDHTVAGERARLGLMSKARARVHRDRSVLTRSLGRELIVPVDRLSNRIYQGDRLLVCSDGLYNTLDDAEIVALMAEGSAPDACRRLVEEANQRGTLDNVSAAVLRVVNGPGTPGPVGRAGGQAPLAVPSWLNPVETWRKNPARPIGEVAEWPKAPDSKSGLGASPTWVRLPPSPLRFTWRGVRVAEGARLEIVCTERYRGFESLSLLQGRLH